MAAPSGRSFPLAHCTDWPARQARPPTFAGGGLYGPVQRRKSSASGSMARDIVPGGEAWCNLLDRLCDPEYDAAGHMTKSMFGRTG